MTIRRNIASAVVGSAFGHLMLVGVAIGWIAFGGMPANDDFSLRTVLGEEAEIVATGSNYAASRERGEPMHAAVEGQSGSVWWSWRAPEGALDVLLEVELQGGDPLLGVYRGFAVDKLEAVGESLSGTLSFVPVAGTDYHIGIAGNGRDVEGAITLHLRAYSDEDHEAPAMEEETALLLPDVVIEEKPEEPEDTRYVRTSQNDPASKAPEDTRFESDRNTVATSELAPDENGLEDMPSQDGEDLPALEMADRESRDGEVTEDATIPIAAVEVAQPADSTASSAEVKLDPSLLADSGTLAAETIGEKLDTEGADEMKVEANEQSAADLDVFQPETRQKKIAGMISARGNEAAVDAAETALGRYQREVNGVIEKRWLHERGKNPGQVSLGSLEVSFVVSPDGKVSKLQVLEDRVSPSTKDLALNSILNAEIPPMPKAVLEVLGGDVLTLPYDWLLID
ncbi:MAG: hypothetical protein ACI8XO_000236 [Verrucomicrobiales bacterium]|jgi:hypothetical protein